MKLATVDPRFTFAVIADSHVEPEAEQDAVPRSNRRNAVVADMINALAPDFVIHCGDIVHTPTFGPYFDDAARASKRVFAGLRCPIWSTPGNQDIGDKALAWMPAPQATAESTARYEQHFGPGYQAFEHKGCHFLFINTPILGTGARLDAEQRTWLEQQLAQRRGRVFLTTHYPPFLFDEHESSHYDNIDPPARAWIIDLIDRFGVEAVFTGHVHNFFYNRLRSTDYYILPSTAFVRRDYAEMFRIPPGDDGEFGRNEPGKLGFLLVDVHDAGHSIRYVRTEGAVAGARLPASRMVSLPLRHPGTGTVAVNLRHAWAEAVELPTNSTTDEFVRKRVRSDTALESLWHLGIACIRIPLDDLRNPVARERLAVMRRLGHVVQAFSASASQQDCAFVESSAGLLDEWEVVIDGPLDHAALARLRECKQRAGVTLSVAALRTSAQQRHADVNYPHFQGAGFDPDGLDASIAASFAGDAIDGICFHAGAQVDPVLAAMAAVRIGERLGKVARLIVGWSPSNPGSANLDDDAIADRVAMMAAAAAALPMCRVIADTYADVDRGYYARRGLVDRRYDPRLPGRVLRHAHEALGAATGDVVPEVSSDVDAAWRCRWSSGGSAVLLSVRRGDLRGSSYAEFARTIPSMTAQSFTITDLDTGLRIGGRSDDRGGVHWNDGGGDQPLPRRALLVATRD